MILLTCSGMNLGSAIWTRRDMDGLCATHDLIRIQPDPERVPPGYLYAFLAGRYGHAWIRKQIYGGSIKHVEPEQVAGMPVPRLDPSVERAADKLVTDASDLMTTSEALLKQATRDFLAAVGMDDLGAQEWAHSGSDLSFSVPRPEVSLRALNFAPRFRTLEARIKSGPWRALGDICAEGTLRRGDRFLRVDADQAHGVELIGQRQLFVLHPRGRYLAKRFLTSDVFVAEGTTLVAARGTLGESELYCRSEFVPKTSDRRGYSEDLLRIRPAEDQMRPGCLYAFLRSDIAFRLLRSISTGSKLQDHHPLLLRQLPVPLPGEAKEQFIAQLVERAYAARLSAIEAHKKAIELVVSAVEESA